MTVTSRDRAGQPSDTDSLHRPWPEVAEAEGFEPPVPLGTLAFKLRAATYGSSHGMRYRWSQPETAITRTVVNRHE
jgi:hypothetical protein